MLSDKKVLKTQGVNDTTIVELCVQDITAEVHKKMNPVNNENLFIVKTGNQWIEQAKNRPIPQMLFSEFWFESELCILFADTNLGKSILAVQIGNSISKGENIYGFKFEAKKQPILYFDFELSDKQFENRYSLDFSEHYHFDNNFMRVEINPDVELPKEQSFEDFLNLSLEQSIIETKSKILIIDNITYLKNETEKAKNALPLMKHLKTLKNKYELSILVLAHTPKRDLSKPISVNDLAGSKMLSNFCDSIFAIGESQKDPTLRYLKQIKTRFTEKIFHDENVISCQIGKPKNFLQFDFIEYGSEREHLKEFTKEEREIRIEEAIELKKQGCTFVEIGLKYGVSEGAVRKWVKSANEETY